MLSRKGSVLLRTAFESEANFVRKVKHKRGSSEFNGTGLLNDRFFRNSKEDIHYSHGTLAQRTLRENRNTNVWELKREGFHNAIYQNTSKLPPRNKEVLHNANRYKKEHTRSHLFKPAQEQYTETPTDVSPRLIQLVRERLKKEDDDGAVVSDDDIKKKLLEANLEIPIAVYLLKQKTTSATANDYGVTTLEIQEHVCAIITEISCESLPTMLDERFLKIAHQISSSTTSLNLSADHTDPKTAFLTSHITVDGNTVLLEDFLVQKSLELNEHISIRRMSIVPWPSHGFLGWYVHNPRDENNKSGGAVCCVSVMVDEVSWDLLEHEWKVKVQSYLGHVLAQHCCLEPLRKGDTGRILKQPLQAPLDDDEKVRFPTGSPTLFDWLDDCCQRYRLPVTRFGFVRNYLSLGTNRTWVSFLAEDHRYGTFSRHNDPQPVEEKYIIGDYTKESTHNSRLKKDYEQQEMWHNEPGQKTFSELELEHKETEQKGSNDGFESDEELINSKQF